MTRTPDEIKKGLECCLGDTHAYHCDECPYADDESEVDDGCGDNGIQLLEDALALIQQLEADNAKKDETIQMLQDGNAHLMRMIDEECEKTVRLEAERDAAIENIRGDCVYCLHLCEDMVAPSCFDCANKGYYRWEWRGVQKEDGNA